MSLNGKLDDFEQADLLAFGRSAGLKRLKAQAIIEEIAAAVGRWSEHAASAGVNKTNSMAIAAAFRGL